MGLDNETEELKAVEKESSADKKNKVKQKLRPVFEQLGMSTEQENELQTEFVKYLENKKERLMPQYEKLKKLGQRIRQTRQDFGIKASQSQRTKIITGFMTCQGEKAKQYDEMASRFRAKRYEN